jgi:hypothetical protein
MKDPELLKSTVRKAEKEVDELLSGVQGGTIDRNRLESGLKEVREQLKTMEIHAYSLGPDDHDADDP